MSQPTGKSFLECLVRAGPARGPDNRPAGLRIAAKSLRQAAQAGLFENKAVFIDHAVWLASPSLSRLAGSAANAPNPPTPTPSPAP